MFKELDRASFHSCVRLYQEITIRTPKEIYKEISLETSRIHQEKVGTKDKERTKEKEKHKERERQITREIITKKSSCLKTLTAQVFALLGGPRTVHETMSASCSSEKSRDEVSSVRSIRLDESFANPS